uniref:Uncharacterized protein n=1 Tax=Octopus bimaculoides TaxID=37653 RepID=A0A0L8HGH9_OCTBM
MCVTISDRVTLVLMQERILMISMGITEAGGGVCVCGGRRRNSDERTALNNL